MQNTIQSYDTRLFVDFIFVAGTFGDFNDDIDLIAGAGLYVVY